MMDGIRIMKSLAKRDNEQGIALLLVTWVIIVLFVIVAEFSFTMRTELQITRNMRDDMECYYFAVAGVQAAYHELLNNVDNVYRNADGTIILEDQAKSQMVSQDKKTGEQVVENLELPPPIRTGIQLGRGYFSYELNDEDGKLNINRIVNVDNRQDSPYQALRRLLIDSGVESGLEVDILMDSILDWRDTNQEHHLNGAEDDWYESNYREQGIDHPYKAKNGAFDSVEELLMVRGFSHEILYGSAKAKEMFGEEFVNSKADDRQYSGVFQFLTVFNVGMKVNENTADDALINAVFPDQSEEILDKRKNNNGRYQDRQLSSYFTITSTGYLPDSDVIHTVQVTVWRRGRQNTTSLEIQLWRDDVTDVSAPVTMAEGTETADDAGFSK